MLGRWLSTVVDVSGVMESKLYINRVTCDWID